MPKIQQGVPRLSHQDEPRLSLPMAAMAEAALSSTSILTSSPERYPLTLTIALSLPNPTPTPISTPTTAYKALPNTWSSHWCGIHMRPVFSVLVTLL